MRPHESNLWCYVAVLQKKKAGAGSVGRLTLVPVRLWGGLCPRSCKQFSEGQMPYGEKERSSP
jgi:hypothetical protein